VNKAIVTTTINPPTEALKKFIKIAKQDDWHIFIVGDRKTPHKDYENIAFVEDCVTYLGIMDQELINEDLSELIGWDCIQRRNFGLIAAYNAGAKIIATVDDDNIPYPSWGKNVKVNKETDVSIYKIKEVAFDPLSPIFPHLWHRGFPIQMLDERTVGKPVMVRRKILVQADFWDGAPDIDAVTRITLNPNVNFNPNMIPIGSDKISPFNSQNTFLSREVIPDYFLFPGIGRMDDIWASYWLQYKFPNSVMYAKASVFQDRNPHDLTKDLEAEMLGYKHNHKIVKDPELIWSLIPERSYKAWQLYKKILAE
jgi:glycosyltransferase involved in cell wall biosynthesis